LEFVERLFAAKGSSVVAVNTKAYRLGKAAGLFFRGLVDGGMAATSALALCRKIAPETIDPSHASAWAKAIGGDDNRLAVLLAAEGNLPGDEVPAFA
jgi:hypothetical protein